MKPKLPTPVIPRGCSLGKPLLMVIPPEGATVHCPVHPDGHRVLGPRTSHL